MVRMIIGTIGAVAAILPLLPAQAADDPNLCPGKTNIILSARLPEVDLFATPAGQPRERSIAKDVFPSCLPIVERSPGKMLRVEIEGQKYWVQPHSVNFRSDAQQATVCRKLAEGAGETKTGTTRGLGEGC